MRSVEVEWQFTVRDVDVLARWLARTRFDDGWTVERCARLQLRDAYYDTTDWRIFRTRHALRVRVGQGAVAATLKAFGTRRGAVARRRELVERVRDGRLATLRSARGAVGRRVRRTVDGGALRKLFALRTRRDVWAVRRHGRVVAELVLDRTRIIARRRARVLERRRARVLQRLEVEVTRGTTAVVARFVATLRRRRQLTLVRQSKFASGLAAAGLVPPSAR